ncbi:MAG: WYL domain-containing protein [Pseudomonadota bacterium]
MLKDRGVPIESDRGRGGGVRVGSSWGVGRISLGYQEAVDLLISLASIEKMKIPIMFANAKSIRTKLVGSFSKQDQQKIRLLTQRIKVGDGSSPAVLSGYSGEPNQNISIVKECFLLMHQVDILYRRADGQLHSRLIEPHYLVLNHPVWYVFAWDHSRNASRTFRLDRIEHAEKNVIQFKVKDWQDFVDLNLAASFDAV